MSTEENIVELQPYENEADSVDEASLMRWWTRTILIGLTAPWIIVFAIAFELDPYQDGEARQMGTHMQLGLPDCNFKVLTGGLPCPSCGMTTSFSLLMHADPLNSARANFAGTALSLFGVLFIPWAIASAFFGRFVFVRSLELVVFRLAIVFLVLLFGRWAIVLAMELLNL
jgi:hypothetical protein